MEILGRVLPRANVMDYLSDCPFKWKQGIGIAEARPKIAEVKGSIFVSDALNQHHI